MKVYRNKFFPKNVFHGVDDDLILEKNHMARFGSFMKEVDIKQEERRLVESEMSRTKRI